MFFMFAIFSQFYPSTEASQQKPPQETAAHRQFVHRNARAGAPVPVEEKSGPIDNRYNLQEEAITPPQILGDFSENILEPFALSRQMPKAASVPIPVSSAPPMPTPAAPQMPPIVINNYTNCSPSVVSSNQNQSEAQSNNSMSAQVSANMSAYMEQAQQMFHEELPHQVVSLKGLLWDYRYHISGGCAVFTYVALCYYLYKAIHYLSYKTVWSSWHKELSLEELLAQDSTLLGKSLILDIQMRYSNSQNPTDFIAPLVTFNVHIQQEIEELRVYWRLYTFCKDWRLIKIVPFSIDQLQILKEHIERAVYVQTIFRSWTANYNFVQNVRI